MENYHRNSGFSQLENGDFPWQNVSSPEGKAPFLNVAPVARKTAPPGSRREGASGGRENKQL